jgi:Mg-chelatase subunit ChlD
MKQYTDITILLDRSGSMRSVKESMEEAFRVFLDENRKMKSTRITLVQFDDVNDQDVVINDVPIGNVEKLDLKPRGNTPLLDAFCKTIDATGKRLSRMHPDDRPDQVMMVVITDGEENASKTYRRQDVFNRVTNQRDNYNWQFLYLGANQDSFAEAQSFGIPIGWTLNFKAHKSGVSSAYAAMSNVAAAYTTNDPGARGLTKSFTPEQQKDADK